MCNSIVQCNRCQQVISEIIFIDGKPYGSTCAARLLGERGETLPRWFKRGDYNKHKETVEKMQAEIRARYELTAEDWDAVVTLCKAARSARNRNNEWEVNFVYSIASQLGYGGHLYHHDWFFDFTDFNDAKDNWGTGDPYDTRGSFPIFSKWVKSLDSMSPKQRSLFDRISSK